MDMQSYYSDFRKHVEELEQKFPGNVVYVTSVFHRERNSSPGCTLSATYRNAARVLTDGTHRVATKGEIEDFLEHQKEEFKRNSALEQSAKKQYIVVMNSNQSDSALVGEVGKGAKVTTQSGAH